MSTPDPPDETTSAEGSGGAAGNKPKAGEATGSAGRADSLHAGHELETLPVGEGRTWLKNAFTIRQTPGRWEKLHLGLACIGCIFLVWWILTGGLFGHRFVNAYSLPGPAETLGSFKSLWFERALPRSTVASLGRVLGGFLLAASIAVPLGVLSGCYLRLDAFLRPISVFGRSVPIAALIPLTLIWFGLGEIQKVLFIFLSSAAFILFDSTGAVASVSNRFLDTAYTLGARNDPKSGLQRAGVCGALYGFFFGLSAWYFSQGNAGFLVGELRWWWSIPIGLVIGFLLWLPIQSSQPVRKVLFPLALPRIVNSLRLLFGLAFGYIMLAEVINAKAGLGSIIIISQRQGPREHIYLILILISLLAFTIDRLVLYLQRRWFPYEENTYA